MADEQSAKERHKAYMKAWRKANKERIVEYQKDWKARNALHVAEYQKAYMDSYRATEDAQFQSWMRNLQRNYKITPEHFNKLWTDQNGGCAVCGVKLMPRGRKSESACVDHNHATGEVRGLLCRQCNHGLGHFKDDPDVLRKAAQYLEERGNYSRLKG